MHSDAETFDPHTERVYQALQVLSACAVAFAHGSNDVANAIGPFSAIYNTYMTAAIPSSKSTTPEWIFVLGAGGMVIGLMMYGYNIIMQLGVNMLHLTPSRGFSAELSAGLTIALASFFGIPVSTTQIIVGAEVGVGLCEGKNGINRKVLLKTFGGWVSTILLGGLFCAALFSAGAYPPSIVQTQEIRMYRTQLIALNSALLKTMNNTNNKWNDDANWWNGTVAPPMSYNGKQLLSVITKNANDMLKLAAPKQYVSAAQVLYYVSQTTLLNTEYSLTAIGQINAPAVLNGTSFYNPQPF